jgi:hypothetical protein
MSDGRQFGRIAIKLKKRRKWLKASQINRMKNKENKTNTGSPTELRDTLQLMKNSILEEYGKCEGCKSQDTREAVYELLYTDLRTKEKLIGISKEVFVKEMSKLFEFYKGNIICSLWEDNTNIDESDRFWSEKFKWSLNAVRGKQYPNPTKPIVTSYGMMIALENLRDNWHLIGTSLPKKIFGVNVHYYDYLVMSIHFEIKPI